MACLPSAATVKYNVAFVATVFIILLDTSCGGATWGGGLRNRRLVVTRELSSRGTTTKK